METRHAYREGRLSVLTSVLGAQDTEEGGPTTHGSSYKAMAFHLLSQQVLNTHSVSKDLRTEEGCR